MVERVVSPRISFERGGEREREIGWESIRPCYRPKLFYDRNSLLGNYFMIGDTFGEMKEMIDDV